MATSIIKTDEIRRLNDQVVMSDGALTSNVVFPAGHVIQVIYNQKTDREALSTSTGYTSIPGTDQDGAGSIFSAHITPTATSSKILVQVNWGGAGSAYMFNTRLYRDSVEIGSGDTIGSRTGAWMQTGDKGGFTNIEFKNNSNSYLDSPNSTSKLVYSVKVWDSRDSGTVYINRMQYDTDDAAMVTSTSSIVLMEIAG